jgi:integrase
MKIEELGKSVLRDMEACGYAESSLHRYGKNFKRIEHWLETKNGGEFTQSAMADYLKDNFRRLRAGEIGRLYHNQLRCAAVLLCEYAESGNIRVAPAPASRKYQPSANAILIIENALSATELKDDFKSKLHIILRQFFCFAESRGQYESKDSITRDSMMSFIHHCRDNNSGSMEYVVRSLKVLANHLVSIGEMANEPNFLFVTPKKSRRRIIPAFYEAELAATLNAIDKGTSTGKRDYAVILLAVGTGLRASDIANLKVTDINWKSQSISIMQGKTGKPLTMPISGQICNAISDYILNGRPEVESANVFLRDRVPYSAFSRGGPLGQILDRICCKAGVEKKHGRRFHSLRRTFGTWLAQEEIPITTIAQMLGHVEMDSSVPYLSFNDNQMRSCAMGFVDIPLKGGVYGEHC